MTENEIIEMLEVEKAYMDSHGGRSQSEALAYAIEAVKEIQQYRAIGTVEQLEWCKDASHWKELFKEKLEQYEAIGTIEEFKALKDKGVAKKPKSNKVIFSGDSYAYCPHCKGSIEAEFMKPRNCRKCGGELDWQ